MTRLQQLSTIILGLIVGAIAFLIPMEYGSWITGILAFCLVVSLVAYRIESLAASKLNEEKEKTQGQLSNLYLSTVKSMAHAISARDHNTHDHIVRVERYAEAIAQAMQLSPEEIAGIKTGALLHDIGKLGIPEYILLKPGRLTEEEYTKIKKHPVIGAAILAPVEFPWPVVPTVKYHHEHWDGNGYPEGISTEKIPLPARILAIADVYDALTSNRIYRDAWSHDRAIQYIRERSGKQFDPKVVEVFLQIIDGVTLVDQINASVPVIEKNAALPAVQSTEIQESQSQQREKRPEPPASQLTVDYSMSDIKPDDAARHIQRASSEVWALYEVAQAFSANLGLQETLTILAQKLEAVFPDTACLFLTKEDKGDILYVRAAAGINRSYFDGAQTLKPESISVQTAKSGRSYIGSYDANDLLFARRDTQDPADKWVSLSSAIIVPIIHEDEILGTINVYHPTENAFDTTDRNLLKIIAGRIGSALYNILLFDRARSHALTDSLTGLYNVRYFTNFVDDLCEQSTRESSTSTTVIQPSLMSQVDYNPIGMNNSNNTDTQPSSSTEKQSGTRRRIRPLTRQLVRRKKMGTHTNAGNHTEENEEETGSIRSEDMHFSLLYLDLNNFKPINDNFGHQTGDKVLRDLGSIFRMTVRQNDVVARYGGDEYVIVLLGADRLSAERVAAEIQRSVSEYRPGLIHPVTGEIRLSVSIGVSCYPEDGYDSATLLAAADQRMFRHKSDQKHTNIQDPQ